MTAANKRDAYAEKMKKQIDEVKGEIDTLEQKGKKASKEAQSTYQEQLNKVRDAQKNLEKKMDELVKAGEGTWEKIKDESEHAWKALTSSVNYFKSQFK